jgi:ribosome production factor 2
MRDLATMRGFKDSNQLYLRKTVETFPFDDIGPVESRCSKHDCSLFVISQNQKKRPENLVFGRLFDGHLLDMFEFGLSNYQPVQQFKAVDVDNQ